MCSDRVRISQCAVVAHRVNTYIGVYLLQLDRDEYFYIRFI